MIITSGYQSKVSSQRKIHNGRKILDAKVIPITRPTVRSKLFGRNSQFSGLFSFGESPDKKLDGVQMYVLHKMLKIMMVVY